MGAESVEVDFMGADEARGDGQPMNHYGFVS